MAVYRLKGRKKHHGPGQVGEAVVYKPGALVESETDLAATLPGKWELVDLDKPVIKVPVQTLGQKKELPGSSPRPAKPTEAPPEPSTEEEGAGTTEEEAVVPTLVKSKYGKDVTVEFDEAVQGGFLVFKNKNGLFSVTEKETPGEKINPKKFKTGKEVQSFLVEMTAK